MVHIYILWIIASHTPSCMCKMRQLSHYDCQWGGPHTWPYLYLIKCLFSYCKVQQIFVLTTHNQHHMRHLVHSEIIVFHVVLTTLFWKSFIGFALHTRNPHNFQHSFTVNKYLQFGCYVQGKQATIDIHNCVGGVCQYMLRNQQVHRVFCLFLCLSHPCMVGKPLWQALSSLPNTHIISGHFFVPCSRLDFTW